MVIMQKETLDSMVEWIEEVIRLYPSNDANTIASRKMVLKDIIEGADQRSWGDHTRQYLVDNLRVPEHVVIAFEMLVVK